MGILPGFHSLPPDEDLVEAYDGRRYACMRCSVPDAEVVKINATEKHIRLHCRVNPYAPLAGRVNNCPSFDEIPGYDELWQPEDNPAVLARWCATPPEAETDATENAG